MIAAQLFHPLLPASALKTQPLEDPGQLLRDQGFSLAKESARIFDQIDVAPRAKPCIMPSRVESKPLRSSIGQSPREASRPTEERRPATLRLSLPRPPRRRACNGAGACQLKEQYAESR